MFCVVRTHCNWLIHVFFWLRGTFQSSLHCEISDPESPITLNDRTLGSMARMLSCRSLGLHPRPSQVHSNFRNIFFMKLSEPSGKLIYYGFWWLHSFSPSFWPLQSVLMMWPIPLALLSARKSLPWSRFDYWLKVDENISGFYPSVGHGDLWCCSIRLKSRRDNSQGNSWSDLLLRCWNVRQFYLSR